MSASREDAAGIPAETNNAFTPEVCFPIICRYWNFMPILHDMSQVQDFINITNGSFYQMLLCCQKLNTF